MIQPCIYKFMRPTIHLKETKRNRVQEHIHTCRGKGASLMFSKHSCDVSATPWTSWFLPTPASRGTGRLCL